MWCLQTLNWLLFGPCPNISCGKYPVKDHVFCPSVHRSVGFNQGYLHGCKSPSTATRHASWIFASRCKIPWFFVEGIADRTWRFMKSLNKIAHARTRMNPSCEVKFTRHFITCICMELQAGLLRRCPDLGAVELQQALTPNLSAQVAGSGRMGWLATWDDLFLTLKHGTCLVLRQTTDYRTLFWEK